MTTSTLYKQTTNTNNIIEIEPNFGNRNIAGMQHKGIINIDGEDKFVKLDSLNPNIAGDWESPYDYKYSSISEAIVSCMINNMDTNKFRSATYDFQVFKQKENIITGTTSNNYMKENETEYLISKGKGEMGYVVMPINEYEEVIDSKINDRIPKLLDKIENHHGNKEEAKQFLIQQVGFDILTGNTERIENQSNLILIYNVQYKNGELFNIDYGRCLQIGTWTETTEEKYDLNDEYYQEDIDMFTDNIVSHNASLINGKTAQEELEYLKENNYKPLKIDRLGLEADLEELKTYIEESDIPCKKFALVKIDVFKNLLDREEVKELWEDTSLQLVCDDIERGYEL